jgi:hypothetical protein
MRRRRYPLLVAALGCYMVILLMPLNVFVRLPFGDWFPPAAAPSRVDGIIVLSSATEPVTTRDRGRISLNA